MRRRRRGWFAVLLVGVAACHQPRHMAPQVPLAGIDGKYTFTIANPFKMEGRFIITHSTAYMIEPRRCVPIEGPKSSDALRSSWFECVAGTQARPSGASLRLRISAVDPINQSRWYQRTTVLDTQARCTMYQNGQCVQGVRARGRKWVDRNGSITVVRGWPEQPDTSRTPEPSTPRRLRVRCDTTAVSGACIPGEQR
jgi:hypothetical protein